LAAYRLTIRNGPSVERRKLATLDEAITALERRAGEIKAEGNLPEVDMLRRFKPADRVHARLEISTGRWPTGREAGLDLMGDGALVPYLGAIFKRKLEPPDGGSPFDAVREALKG
jgi:hypothetical protein